MIAFSSLGNWFIRSRTFMLQYFGEYIDLNHMLTTVSLTLIIIYIFIFYSININVIYKL